MRRLLTGLACATLFASAAFGQAFLDEDILSAQTASFAVFDANGDGKAEAFEIAAGAKEVFAALDTDAGGIVTPDEFQAFSMGLQPLADRILRRDEYAQARAAIFARWDANADQQLIQPEVTAALLEEALASLESGLDQPGFAKLRFMAEMEAVLR
jgi:EF hand